MCVQIFCLKRSLLWNYLEKFLIKLIPFLVDYPVIDIHLLSLKLLTKKFFEILRIMEIFMPELREMIFYFALYYVAEKIHNRFLE